MKFEMTHEIFGTITFWDETSPPSWLVCEEYLWFYEKYVLTLGINEYVDTEFQRIRRMA